MRRFPKSPLFATAAVALALAADAGAQIVVPDGVLARPQSPQVRLESYRIRAEVDEALAHYTVEQTFRNTTSTIQEGVYLFPIPRGAVPGRMSLVMNGREVPGEVLEAGKARQTYQDIVRRTKDPGLLEYVDDGMLRASIFPIPPGGTMQAKLSFTAAAERSAELHSIALPLRFAAESGAAVTIDLALESSVPLTTIYSPTHDVDVSRAGERAARVTYEGTPTGRTDFRLYFARTEGEMGIAVLTHRLAGRDGTFALVLSPRAEAKDAAPRDVVFVLDRSGSMAGAKWEQACAALRHGLATLRPQDRFALISFATDVRSYKPGLVPATEAEVAAARAHLDELAPAGGTNIAEALLGAFPRFDRLGGDGEEGARLRLVAFLTDGLPTIGETAPAAILSSVALVNTGGARLFTFGVGYDVDTFLLDRLAQENRGASDYVADGENLEVRVSGFFSKVAEPVLIDPVVTIEGVEVYDTIPQRLPDLFAGSSLVVLGRYRGTGPHAITLRGRGRNGEVAFVSEATFPEADAERSFLPPLFAARKCGALLAQIRLNGPSPELVDAVIALGREYGIVTPYTASLVVEEGLLASETAGLRAQRRDEDAAWEERDRAEKKARASLEELALAGNGDDASAPAAVGRDAVERAKAIVDLVEAQVAGEPGKDGLTGVETVHAAGRTFVRLDGTLVDLAFERDMASSIETIAAFSDAYFALLDLHPELKDVLSLGDDMLLVVDGRAVRIGPEA